MGIVFISTLFYLPLLIIGIIFLRGAIKRRHRTQSAIFSLCVVLCLYAVLRGIWEGYLIEKRDREYAVQTFQNLSRGDTATIEGLLFFDVTRPYDKQDSFNKALHLENNYVNVLLPLRNEENHPEVIELIFMSKGEFTKVANYLKLQEQEQGNFSFTVRARAQKINDVNGWQLIDTILFTKINGPPAK